MLISFFLVVSVLSSLPDSKPDPPSACSSSSVASSLLPDSSEDSEGGGFVFGSPEILSMAEGTHRVHTTIFLEKRTHLHLMFDIILQIRQIHTMTSAM